MFPEFSEFPHLKSFKYALCIKGIGIRSAIYYLGV